MLERHSASCELDFGEAKQRMFGGRYFYAGLVY